ncbi:hypothetical protein [Alkalicoccus urumqiensis]|uniref:Uncharacterized protein n=1 Tax=Alkalicoccus urumqiensis TaxID=1548213 RepID=A0A2P6MIS3_ALKUR|nr:hypothetical protein [Alkalicoccus urumqiensis]PRO66158.1 hypothetical protein C6I21_04980 [Alkalicoccus urumqiensis]
MNSMLQILFTAAAIFIGVHALFLSLRLIHFALSRKWKRETPEKRDGAHPFSIILEGGTRTAEDLRSVFSQLKGVGDIWVLTNADEEEALRPFSMKLDMEKSVELPAGQVVRHSCIIPGLYQLTGAGSGSPDLWITASRLSRGNILCLIPEGAALAGDAFVQIPWKKLNKGMLLAGTVHWSSVTPFSLGGLSRFRLLHQRTWQAYREYPIFMISKTAFSRFGSYEMCLAYFEKHPGRCTAAGAPRYIRTAEAEKNASFSWMERGGLSMELLFVLLVLTAWFSGGAEGAAGWLLVSFLFYYCMITGVVLTAWVLFIDTDMLPGNILLTGLLSLHGLWLARFWWRVKQKKPKEKPLRKKPDMIVKVD